uniref:Putative secreted peptide n=1 Tax=Anopheles braziliensis TaxID=58242 RepID=A0A2M3ZTN2_9DIPT
MMLLVCISVIPVKLVVYDVLARVSWSGPLQGDSCFADIGCAKVARLRGNSLLGFNLYRIGQWTSTHGGKCLHPYCIYRMRRQIGNRRHIVGFLLRVPRCFGLVRVCRIIHFVTSHLSIRSLRWFPGNEHC